MGQFTQELGLKVNVMEKELKYGMTDHIMKDIGVTIKQMEKAV